MGLIAGLTAGHYTEGARAALGVPPLAARGHTASRGAEAGLRYYQRVRKLAKGTITGALSYVALEDAFARELAEADRASGRVWVLAPTNLLALHLRRQSARRAGGVAGVEFLTLKDAARRLALHSFALQGRRPLPAGAVELVLQRLLEGVPPGSYLAAFSRFTNGARAIARAISILEDCLWTPHALRAAATGPASAGLAAGDPAAARRLRELADIWGRLQEWKDARALFEDQDLMREAGRMDAEPADGPDMLFIYGFYDFNPSQRSLMGRLILLARRCSVYLLWAEEDGRPAPGFEYALPVVEWLKATPGADGVQRLLRSPAATDLERLMEGIFREYPRPVGEAQAREALERAASALDGTVRMLSCPGEVPEALEAAREVLRVAQRASGAQSTGVLLRAPEEHAALVAEAIDRAGFRCYMREGAPLAGTLAGRVALSLIDLATGDSERTAVVDLLSLCEIRWPVGLSASALDRLSRQAGIIKGRAEWVGRLRGLAAQLRRDGAQADDEAEGRACARDAELCMTAAGFLREFFEKIAPLSAPVSWADAARCLGSLVQEYAPARNGDGDANGTAPVLEAIEGLKALGITEAVPAAERIRWLLARRLSEHGLRRERFQHVGATVSSIMGARGVTFDTVVVPGLVEKSFPRHIPEHSLLTELDREALNEAAKRLGCGQLPLQRNRPLEERYLFRIALGSARRALVLTYSRLEQDSGRPRIPSRFVAEVCSALAGCSVSASTIENGAPGGLVAHVPLNRRAWDAEQLGLALDTLEYDGAVFTGPSGRERRCAYLAAVSGTFRRSEQMDEARWRTNNFGTYDGKIRAHDLLERLREKHRLAAGAPSAPLVISPTRFETYAGCPFAYFLTYVLEVSEVEAPSEDLQLPPQERGSLVHDLLCQLYRERLKDRPFGRLSSEEIEATAARGAEILGDLGRLHAQNHPGTWTTERERILDELKALLVHEHTKHAAAAPALFEYEFGTSEQAPFVLSLGPDAVVAFRGFVDRIDALPGGGIQVVDYKTGRPDRYKENRLLGGLQLQLPIYLLATAKLLKATEASARYLMVSGPKDVPEFTLEELTARMDEFRRALRLIAEGIAAGDFFPLPAQTGDAQRLCEDYCRYGIACGAARRSLAQMKQTDPDAARLAALRKIE